MPVLPPNALTISHPAACQYSSVSMIMLTVRTCGRYAVTKCYSPFANCTRYDGIFLINFFCSTKQN